MSCRRSRCAGASVLFYDVDSNQGLSFLLGQDQGRKHGKWSDFGGGANHLELELSCAQRELEEETHGLFSSCTLATCPRIRFTFFDYKKNLRHYTTYLVHLSFNDELPEQFKAKRRLVRCQQLSRTLREARLEKQHIRWIELDELQQYKLRSFFKTRIELMVPFLQNLPSLKQQIQTEPLATIDIGVP